MVDARCFVTLQHGRDRGGDVGGGRSGALQQQAEDFADLRHRDGRCFFSDSAAAQASARIHAGSFGRPRNGCFFRPPRTGGCTTDRTRIRVLHGTSSTYRSPRFRSVARNSQTRPNSSSAVTQPCGTFRERWISFNARFHFGANFTAFGTWHFCRRAPFCAHFSGRYSCRSSGAARPAETHVRNTPA